MTGVGGMACCRRGFLGVGGSPSSEDAGEGTRFLLAFTGTRSSSESEGGGAFGCFFWQCGTVLHLGILALVDHRLCVRYHHDHFYWA